MVFKVLAMLVIFKIASCIPDPNVNVNVDVDVNSGEEKKPEEIKCQPKFHKIPGCTLCYFWSVEEGVDPLNWDDAEEYCEGMNAKLASAGHFPATQGDPVLEYVKDNNFTATLLGARKTGSAWNWMDGRKLSVSSNMWCEESPSGDGDCVEVFPYPMRSYLTNLDCIGEIRPFVCQQD